MPARQNVKTIPTPAVQGDDSWIKIKAMTVEQFNRNQAILRQAQQPDANAETLDSLATELFAEVVMDWNWVDDDGKPLPKPNGNPKVFGTLTMAELLTIGEALRPAIDEKKDNPS